ncbi:MAG: signal peptidase II [Chloroflexi bacterium]|nr:signal peptidase II [Chloroflexota bacterium]
MVEQPSREAAPQRRALVWFSLALAALIVLADQLSKYWIRANLHPWESMPENGFFRLTHVLNTGSAFGLFANQTAILTIISVVAVGALLFFLRHRPLRSGWGSAAIGLLLGGSIGNLIDRARLGYVTDFIDIGPEHGFRFYTFNVADSAITVGVIVLAIAVLLMERQQSRQTPPTSTPH